VVPSMFIYAGVGRVTLLDCLMMTVFRYPVVAGYNWVARNRAN
jgi:hypothetical protein